MKTLNGTTPPNDALERLINEINADYAATAATTGLTHMSRAVENAMRSVPREQFVSDEHKASAYGNYPLPIGCDQTISQPYIVALMTDLLDINANSKVLEIGTGCGYQTAVLGEIAATVYSIEIHPSLGEAAFQRLHQLGYSNIHYRSDDGSRGWPEAEPFDGIIVTACDRKIPNALANQLADNGRLVMPLEHSYGKQQLTVIRKSGDGAIEQKAVLSVRFVPVTH